MCKMNRYIVTHDSDSIRYGNGFVIANHYHQSLAKYQELFKLAQRDFPQLTSEDIFCYTVRKSLWCESRIAIRFALPPDTQVAGWTSIEGMIPGVAF